jgi:hypothetical protein
MRFLRENLFFAVLIGMTVVLAAAGLIYYFTSDVREKLGSRRRISSKITKLRQRREKVDADAVPNQRDRIEKLRAKAKKDVADGIAFNRANLPVLKIRVGGMLEPILPIDEKRKSDQGLDLLFIREYTRTLDDMISPTQAELKPTSLATAEEIRKQAILLKEQFGPQAEGKAKEFMKLQKARDGLIYIEDNAMDRQFAVDPRSRTPKETKATSKRIWEAQVNLWVTREVLGAISATNLEVVGEGKEPGIPRASADVLSSAVKHLVKININEPFAVTAAAGLFGAKDQAGNLTNRISTSEYGVIRYQFVVVMPTRHVEKLLRNLMMRNYHTVVSVATGEVPRQSPHYYGVEPVMMVSIAAEMLLLSDWIRPLMPPGVAATLPKAKAGA